MPGVFLHPFAKPTRERFITIARGDGARFDAALKRVFLAAAQDVNWGPIQRAGRLHDRASYRYYWELLQRARSTGMTVSEPALSRFFN